MARRIVAGRADPFEDYLARAASFALSRAHSGEDDEQLKCVSELCLRGVRANHATMTATGFLTEFLWCVGSIQKPYARRPWSAQQRLFRRCQPDVVVQEQSQLWRDWEHDKCDLNGMMVDAVCRVAVTMRELGWAQFKSEYLILPSNSETELQADWLPAHARLDSFYMVGPVIAWYLIRNLYGAPFFKPDMHVQRVSRRFFGGEADPVGALGAAAKRVWPAVWPGHEQRKLPAHLGIIDYVIWHYESQRDGSGSDCRS